MNNNKKLIIAIVCVITCIGFISGGIMLYLGKKDKWPPDDIYVYNSNGYMAIEMDEEINIAMLLCSVHRNGKNPIEKYEKMYFETTSGDRYEADLEDNIKDSFYDKDNSYSEVISLFKIGGVFLSGETYDFDKLILQRKDGTYVTHQFGNIRIEMLKGADTDDKVSINIPSPLNEKLEKFDFTIENKMQTDLTVKEIYLGDTIEYTIDPFSISASDEKKLEIELTGTEKFSESPYFYVIKPKITLVTSDGEEYVCSTIGNKFYSKQDSQETIQEYLLNYPNRIE